MNGKGKTILLILGILFSLAVIGGVFYMVQQQQEVAPTPTPVSTPTPAPIDVFEINEQDTCTISFVVPVPGDPTLLCVSKVAWENEDSNTQSNYTLITETDTFTPGDIVVYKITYSTDVIENFTVTDELDANVTFLDSESGCTHDELTNIVTCEVDTTTEPDGAVMYRVITNEDLTTATSIANLATLTTTNTEVDSDTCSSTITFTPAVSPSPSPSPSTNPSDNPSTPPSKAGSPTPTPSVSTPPVSTNPTPSTLPQAGIAELTTGTVSIGILLLLIGLAGLLII